MGARLELHPLILPRRHIFKNVLACRAEALTISLGRRTCAAGVVAHGQRVSVVVGVHGEEADSEGAVLGVRRAVFKVLQVDAQLVVALDGQGVDLLQPCSRKQTERRRQEGRCQRGGGGGGMIWSLTFKGISPRDYFWSPDVLVSGVFRREMILF